LGIVGLKPTYGLVGMRGGGEAGWWSMNHLGPMCRSVADVALVLSAIAGYDPRDSTSVEVPIPSYTAALRAKVSALRLGVPRAVFYDKLDPEIEAAINTALGLLRRLTGGVREVSLPPISDSIAPNIVLAENYAFHALYFAKTPELYHAAIGRNLQQGSKVSTAAYIQSRRELDEARRTIGTVFSDVDLLVTPTTAVAPPTIEEAVRLGIELEMNRNTGLFNVYGLPTISIPCGCTSSGLPIGMQISGPHFGEAKVLMLANAYEQATHLRLVGGTSGKSTHGSGSFATIVRFFPPNNRVAAIAAPRMPKAEQVSCLRGDGASASQRVADLKAQVTAHGDLSTSLAFDKQSAAARADTSRFASCEVRSSVVF
jgi:aspartyl-tRNA(Asn)/glutamyl-tRNA(Gln) amidotransferase subunit A